MSTEGEFRWSRWIRLGAPGSRVTRLELFFDLVYVFAFLNVTQLTGEELGLLGLLRALLVLALLWWCWTSMAALGNLIRADQGIVPVIVFINMAAVFVLALTISEAFVDQPGGLHGPLLFAACYFIVRAMQVAIVWGVNRVTPGPRHGVLLFAAPILISATLIGIAGFVPARLFAGDAEYAVRLSLWLAALAVEYGFGTKIYTSRWTLTSAGHWAERHALIVLVALGESIISLGVGANLIGSAPVSWQAVAAAVFGIAVIAALWWAYFDEPALAIEQVLHGTRERRARMRLVRDAYTFLHLPMIIGIILFALGLKKYLTDITADTSTGWQHRIGGIELDVLYGGVLLYLTALVAMAWRVLPGFRPSLILPFVGILLLITVVLRPPALIALGILAAGSVTVAVTQIRHRERHRSRIRETALNEQLASEADQSEWRRKHL
ncbi:MULTISPECIES: low temperature requirement protein A [Polymorphospora]|uniref:Low temperature requirement protein A n=1 Tax=Polymorphospora lycopeni TaxID=3140240 RepID=A0ABV5D0U3_9ACTN